MATTYVGNPANVQAPDVGCEPGQATQVTIPAGTDALSIESITQNMKVHADKHTYLQSGLYSRYEENFMLPDTVAVTPATSLANYGRLGAVATNGQLIPVGGQSSVASYYQGRAMQCHLTATAASNIAFWATSGTMLPINLANGGDQVFCLDIPFWLSAVAASSLNHFIGFANAQSWTTATPPASNSIGIQLTGGTGQWTAYGVTAPVTISATYNPIANKPQRLRIEWFGGNSPTGIANANTGLLRFSMSTPGTSALVQVATMSANPTGWNNLYIVGGTTAQNTTAGADFFCGQWIAQSSSIAVNI